ncbi:MAG: lipid A phosphoethanolamine transferase, partial [Proteobacteria bacterium]|nr:lipid A phosphoethanolamine transferase [Pseudomonadota bacterium]
NKILLKFFLILGFFLSTIFVYVFNKFGIILDAAMITNALESIGHTDEVIDYSIVIYFFFLTLVPAFLVFRVEIFSKNVRQKIITFFVFVTFLTVLQISFTAEKIIRSASLAYSPINYSVAIYEYFARFRSQLKQGENRKSLSEIYKFQRQKNIKDLNIILIIGESLRADHLFLNGYQRETNPNLEKISDLLNFTISASFNTTTRSVTSMLSHRTKSDFIDIPPEKSVVSTFKELGFHTYWYSAQSSKEFRNGMLSIMASEADDYFFRDRLQAKIHSSKIYDEALIPELQEVLKKGGNNFVVLHSFGNHIRYHERYPENFKKFLPECRSLPSSCAHDDLVNSYDNSVLYTDYFVSQVVESLKDTNSLLFFVADHGVFLGEDGMQANGNSEDESDAVKKVPMFFYMTNSLKKDKFFRQKFSNATKKTSLHNLSHNNLFDSLLDCSGIESDLFERNLSICKK